MAMPVSVPGEKTRLGMAAAMIRPTFAIVLGVLAWFIVIGVATAGFAAQVTRHDFEILGEEVLGFAAAFAVAGTIAGFVASATSGHRRWTIAFGAISPALLAASPAIFRWWIFRVTAPNVAWGERVWASAVGSMEAGSMVGLIAGLVISGLVVVAAVVERRTTSWQFGLIVAVAVAVLGLVGLPMMMPYVFEWLKWYAGPNYRYMYDRLISGAAIGAGTGAPMGAVVVGMIARWFAAAGQGRGRQAVQAAQQTRAIVALSVESPVARLTMWKSVLVAALILSQAAVLLAAGVATLWWSEELMGWLIYMVGEERVLGADNVIHLENGGKLLTNPVAMMRWTIPFWVLGMVQITAAITLVGLWASCRRFRPGRAAALLAVALGLVVSGCSGPLPETTTLKQADRLVLYEGLPHPMYEHEALEAEKKSKPTLTLHEFPFYSETLELKAGDGERLKTLLGDPASFEPHSGEKKCGGFHPDYAVEWETRGQTYQALICLGCWEINVYGPKGGAIYDIRNDARDRLKPLLEPYRKNRPPFKPTL
jgi:hypothetical protein